jgi:Protein of unknown function (DUF1236)
MKLRIVTALVATVAFVPTIALAQDPGRAANRGAAEGARVGGPVGAFVGGTVGLATGIAEGVVDAVRVAPAPNVVIRERVVVGEPLPREVRLYEVPRYRAYRYAVVNDERVIVDPRTRRVIRVIE